MKRIHIATAAASVAFLATIGCSDPAANVHKSSASDAQKTTLSSSQPGKEYIVRAESTIGFIGSKVTGSHSGGFKNITGKINVADGKIVGTPEIKIAMESTWTDQNRLTGHLKSADFFDVPNFPVATFAVTRIEPSGARQNVTGNLNLHGVTKSVSFPASIQITDDTVSLKAEFAINRREFNINYAGKANDLIRDDVVIKLDLQATPGAPRPQDQLAN